MQRVILHVDMDYFFAAIEERENPELRGKAIVVCMFSGRNELSGAVSACNYVAREYGIISGIPCSKAKKLNPKAVFLPVRKEFYTRFRTGSWKFFEVMLISERIGIPLSK